jgi:hypothetical protein
MTFRAKKKFSSLEGEDVNSDEDIELKMSVVGRKMTESITKKGNK